MKATKTTTYLVRVYYFDGEIHEMTFLVNPRKWLRRFTNDENISHIEIKEG